MPNLYVCGGRDVTDDRVETISDWVVMANPRSFE